MRTAVVEWEGWDGFLLPYLIPGCTRIPIDPFQPSSADMWRAVANGFDLVCFHINLSCLTGLPFDVAQMAESLRGRGVTTVNGRCLDITKRRLHRILRACGLSSLDRPDPGDSDDLMIVKTNLNYGGEVEKEHEERMVLGAAARSLITRDLGSKSYYVVAERNVPRHLYEDQRYVIENFISNRDDYFYRLYCAGSRRVAVKAYSPGVIKKVAGDERDFNFAFDASEPDGAAEYLPQSVIDIALQLPPAIGAEYGCVDIVISDAGNAFAVDFNNTPHAGQNAPPEDVRVFLCDGLEALRG